MTFPRCLLTSSVLIAFGASCSQSSALEPSFDSKGDGFGSNVSDRGELRFGGEATDAFERDFQFFAFTFDAIANAEVRVEVTQRGSSRSLDTSLFLYRLSTGSEPERIAFDDDDGFGALSKIEDFRLFSDDRYAIVVGTKAGDGRGNFRLTLDCLSGDCTPSTTACPGTLVQAIIDCVAESSEENNFEAPLVDLVAEQCGTASFIAEVKNDICAGNSNAFCEGDRAVIECQRFAEASYPALGDLPSDLAERSNSRLDDIVLDFNDDSCGDISGDAGCQMQAATFDVNRATVSIEELLAHARTLTDFGPGVLVQQTTGLDGTDAFIAQLSSWGITNDFLRVLEDFDLDFDDGEYATATGDEFQFNFGDCVGDIAVAHFKEIGLVINLNEFFCAG